MFQIEEFWQKSMDALTSTLRTITMDHAYIHEGKAFRTNWKTASLAAGATETTVITTGPTTKYVHLRPAVFASTANLAEVTITEGATVTGGTALTVVNQNRNSALTTTAIVKQGVTISVAGTLEVGKYSIGSGGIPSAPKSGGSVGADNEIVLKPSTAYTIEIKNVGSTTATVVYANLFWYEE